jgi:3-phenylpropionate/trans-cinnamate dioxygenase ferredoxin component
LVEEDFVKVCAVTALADGVAKSFTIGEEIIILAKWEGNIHALSGECTHDGNDLDGSTVANGQIECPRHGAKFDIMTGNVLRMPAVVGLRKYDVKEVNGEVFVAL